MQKILNLKRKENENENIEKTRIYIFCILNNTEAQHRENTEWQNNSYRKQ